jgi:protein-S-isoprenylcysteine O-methyltransferase Ste14
MLGKLFYAVAFCCVLPALLVVWARAVDAGHPGLPRLGGWPLGLLLICTGGGLVLRAMWELWHVGGGLPMNAFPPERFVASGLYGWLPHPIYVGFAFLMSGFFLAAGIPSGVWVVSPVLWLGMAALVIGYERLDLQRRFGSDLPHPRLAMPPDVPARPRWWHRASVYVLALGPWLVAYESVALLLRSRTGWETYLPFERHWMPLEWTVVLYAGAYVWVALAPLAATSQASLRRFIRDGWIGSAIILWCFLVFPLIATPRPLGARTWLGMLLEIERACDTAFCALPSFHVFWPFLAARLWTGRLPAILSYLLAALMAASCVTAGVHSVSDVASGFAVFAAVNRLDDLWRRLLGMTEAVANSWRDWRAGPIRIISHGAFAAAAAGSGLWLAGTLLGNKLTGSTLIVAFCSLIGACIWAQLLESSFGLSRPFGYYGGIVGGCIGVLAVQLWNGQGWMVLGAFAVASPLIQSVGRLRCLVQGCCHGRPCPDHLGIRYRRPRSRVCTMTPWAEVPLYPTPLHSIIGNAVICGLVLRLWFLGGGLGFIAGSYAILSACARFMEEAYRGEPQTLRFRGLTLYQWLALLFVIGGAMLTAMPSPAAPAPAGFAVQSLLSAVLFGLLVWFAMGVDFPESNRRFSRLA